MHADRIAPTGTSLPLFVRFESWSRENSGARCARRNILEKLRVMRTDYAAGMRWMLFLRIVFSTFPRCMSFHTAQGHNLKRS